MEINVDHFARMCRTCLSEESLCPISSTKLRNGLLVVNVLSGFIPTMDLENSNFPQQICLMCIDYLNLICNFRDTCNENERLFKSCLEQCTIKTEEEIKTEPDDDDENSLYSPTVDELNLIKRVFTCSDEERHKVKKSLDRHKKWILDETEEELEDVPNIEKGEVKHFKCKQCHKPFRMKYMLVRHMRIHTKEKPFKCDKCNLRFSVNWNLKRHMRAHSQEGSWERPCRRRAFNQSTSLQSQPIKRKKQRDFTCESCTRVFARNRDYRLHMKKYHPQERETKLFEETEQAEREALKQYICSTCGNEFAKLVYLKRHEARHGEKKFLCSDCGKGFVLKVELQSHVKVHTREKPHKCSICNKSFAHTGSLGRHSMVHTKLKAYSCDVCSRQFSQHSHLKAHQRMHNGEKPYSCSYCGKSFSQSVNLTVHTRIHTKETPYVCITCGRGFYNSNSMKKHKCTYLNLAENENKGESN